MPTYVIGDVQGCFSELKALLQKIQFDKNQDTLWFTGDLVNRGPDSLEVLRFIQSLGEKHKVVLGNHDLHLIAVAFGVRNLHVDDTLNPILTARDCDQLIDWLRHRSLLHVEKNYVMVHAGFAPSWTLEKAKLLAKEVETVLASSSPHAFLQHMYGNQPDHWDDQLKGQDRWRCITNYLTRIRFCHADGRIDLSYKGELGGEPEGLLPWFLVPNRQMQDVKIIFGHWAALGGKAIAPSIYPMDTGCVWGNCLTAMRLEDAMRFSVKC